MRLGLLLAGMLVLLSVLPVVAIGAIDDESGMRTVTLDDSWHVPGPVIALVAAVLGTLVVEVARRVLRATRAPRPAA